MKMPSKITVALAGAAMVLASATPAAARGYDGRWGDRGWGRYPSHHHHHRYRDRDNSGAVIGAIVGVGLIAAIASVASKRNAERRYDDPRDDDGRYNDADYNDGDYGYAGRADDWRTDDYAATAADEHAAVDACALAAREEASRMGGFADLRDITGARPFGNGWDVTGTVSQRASYSAPESRVRSFRCIWDAGRIEGVTFG